ncbi:ligase-associated DNA damage response endonuclease PdeM [Luteolibacter sp. AS25]|uniref:ligase-associated DNA damage response endonuclease PdeM n=1 Tax=Luteolibacter sp. AS25 TaxID=3135776 RepID=UPI00398BB714
MRLPQHDITLLPDHSLLIEKEKRHLVLADVHLGKSATFRAEGLAVPEGDSKKDLDRIAALADRYSPDQIIIAGDLFHAATGLTPDLFELVSDFVGSLAISVVLVKGNHDQKIKHLPDFLPQPDYLDIGSIRIIHKPEEASPDHFNICGHIHPIVKIPDGKRTHLRMPCFHLRENTLTIPSFGSFTGGQIVRPAPADRFFVTHQSAVIELPDAIFQK